MIWLFILAAVALAIALPAVFIGWIFHRLTQRLLS